MKLSTIHILVPIFLIPSSGTAIAVSIAPGTAAVFNPGPHGFSEILYAFSSVSQNNGSAFAGLSSNLFYTLATAICMFVGGYAIAIITLALAGAFVTKEIAPVSEGKKPRRTTRRSLSSGWSLPSSL